MCRSELQARRQDIDASGQQRYLRHRQKVQLSQSLGTHSGEYRDLEPPNSRNEEKQS